MKTNTIRCINLLRLPLLFLFSTLIIPSARASDLSIPAPFQVLAESNISSAQLLSLTTEAPDRKILAVAWEDDKKPSVTFGLIKKAENAASALWLKEAIDAYDPTLKQITNWEYKQRPVIAFLYSQGSTARQIEIYGLNHESLQLLDQKLGEAVEWKILKDGDLSLVVYSKPNGHLEPDCFAWDVKYSKLRATNCSQ